MSLRTLLWRNLRQNIKNYYLYVFALVFTVALYFSFVTLQHDAALDELDSSMKGGAAIGASSVLLVAIVAIFLLYANMLFIKRRSREIGLLQLIGLTRSRIFRLLSSENLILYIGSLMLGIGVGFAISRLMMMILYKLIAVELPAQLHFSVQALAQTLIVYALIYVVIMISSYLFIKSQSILSLFRVQATTQGRVRKLSFWTMLSGLIGLAGIGGGYYMSSRLFSGAFTDTPQLMTAMITILALTIIGTYLFYKSSVSMLFNMLRKSRNGFLSVRDVLSISSIMFRMKSNALLLTVITTVSALAIGLLSLAYITYYSIETSARDFAPQHFGLSNPEDAQRFGQMLTAADIAYRPSEFQVLHFEVDTANLESGRGKTPDHIQTFMPIIASSSFDGPELADDEVQVLRVNGMMKHFFSSKQGTSLDIVTTADTRTMQVSGLDDKSVLPLYFGMTLVVNEQVYSQLKHTADPDMHSIRNQYYGFDLVDDSQLREAALLFDQLAWDGMGVSRYDYIINQRTGMGLVMFIVAFIGLAFLITSGCILYFKQMDEGEEEKASYTTLRKLGFTQSDLMSGIRRKQLFNFSIPLIIGLAHSYFAVKSGWFLFGTEMLTPMLVVMLVYTGLYSIFGMLATLYYKRMIRYSL